MIYSIVIVLIIISIKAMFSAADTAFTYMNRAEIKQLSKTDKKAAKIRVLMEDSNKFFGIIEVVINMCELLASAVVSISVLEWLIDEFEKMNIETNIAIILAVVIVTVILAYLMLVFGGVLPKRIARNNPKKVAYKLIPILWIVAKLNYPFERLIDISTNIFSRIFKIKQEPEEKMTEKQLKMIIKEAKDEGVLEGIEKRIFMNTLKANDILVGKTMVPIEDAYLIDINSSITNIFDEMKKNKYTRIPVYDGEKNNIIGIFNMKEIATQYMQKGINTKEEIKKMIRKPNIIKESEKIFSAFRNLQKNNQIMAIVVNEDNVPVGIITIEDILEKLVGKMFDENDMIN